MRHIRLTLRFHPSLSENIRSFFHALLKAAGIKPHPRASSMEPAVLIPPPGQHRRGAMTCGGPMGNELIVRPQVPARYEHKSLSGAVFGRTPKTIAKRTTLMIAAAILLYFGVLGTAVQRVDADPDFSPPAPIENGSHAVNMSVALIERELQTHRWAPNDPVFYPTVFHDNMANYQRGVMRAVSRFMLELETQIGRLNGTSAIDRDLERATGLLQVPTDVWMFDFEQSFLPVQPADSAFRAAARALNAYNTRVADGEAAFETRGDALVLTMERMVGEFGARAARIDKHTRESTRMLNTESDDIFYFNKGFSYATYMILRELGRDFERVITQAGAEAGWAQMLESLRNAAIQRPLVVLNSSGDDSFFANHLHMQGFYLKRSLLQMEQMMGVLRNT
jgi:hypothetical protein